MSILDKLKDLVASLEENREAKQELEIQEELAKHIEEIQAEEQDSSEQEVEEEPVEEFPDYLECGEEESSELYELLSQIRQDKETISDILMDFERKKAILLRKISKNTEEFYSKLNSLRLEYGIPAEGYVVELPSSPEDKVSFKKE